MALHQIYCQYINSYEQLNHLFSLPLYFSLTQSTVGLSTTHFQAKGLLLRILGMLFVYLRQVEIIETEFIYTRKEKKCF